uniref:Uncharacterized protein n=1 Tax=Cannabis sativa TaxID=3483 RepID=A0A803PBU2_CANSA
MHGGCRCKPVKRRAHAKKDKGRPSDCLSRSGQWTEGSRPEVLSRLDPSPMATPTAVSVRHEVDRRLTLRDHVMSETERRPSVSSLPHWISSQAWCSTVGWRRQLGHALFGKAH